MVYASSHDQMTICTVYNGTVKLLDSQQPCCCRLVTGRSASTVRVYCIAAGSSGTGADRSGGWWREEEVCTGDCG